MHGFYIVTPLINWCHDLINYVPLVSQVTVSSQVEDEDDLDSKDQSEEEDDEEEEEEDDE